MVNGDSFYSAAKEHVKASLADVEFELAAIIKSGDSLSAYNKEFVSKCSLLGPDETFEVGEKLKRSLKGFKVKEWKDRIKRERETFTPASLNGHRGGWREKLLKTETRTVRPILANAITALRNAPEWQGVLAYNELSQRPGKLKPAPFDTNGLKNRCWTDQDDILLADWLQHNDIMVNSAVASEAAQAVAMDASFHPIQEYLTSVKWDGEPRVQGWLTKYLGVEKTEYTIAVGTKWLISAVARAMRPGCKVDTCLILEGVQGLRKSSGLAALAGDDWFTDQLSDVGSKDSSQDLAGKWIVEFADLAPMSRAETRTLKSFVTRRIDHYRPSYGRRSADFPRHCVFAATTNESTYLQDETGGRRWWPVYCHKIDLKKIAADRDQLWAEAYGMWLEGKSWWIEDKAVAEVAMSEQDARREEDSWDEMIWTWVKKQEKTWPTADEERASYLEGREPDAYYTSTEEILAQCIKKSPETWTKSDQMRVGAILRLHGMKRRQKRVGDVIAKRYYMPTDTAESQFAEMQGSTETGRQD